MTSKLGFVGAEAEGGERQAQDCLRGRDRRLSTACPRPREIGELDVSISFSRPHREVLSTFIAVLAMLSVLFILSREGPSSRI